MRNNLFFKISKNLICFFLPVMVCTGILCSTVTAQSSIHTADGIENAIGGILAWKQQDTGTGGSVQDLIDKGLSQSAGTASSDWYIIGLKQYQNSYSYNSYLTALKQYTDSSIKPNAVEKQRIALTYAVLGGGSAFITQTTRDSIGKLGVMSSIYGLILLDSGAYTSSAFTRDEIIRKILTDRRPDGGWALSGTVSDPDVTSMALQSLAPYYQYTDVKSAADQALNLLSRKQLDNGDYSSWGTRNAESTAQVLCALSALKIDYRTDRRFIKNGHTLLDGLLLYRLGNGSFSHTIGGSSDNNASVQAFLSLLSIYRLNKVYLRLFQFTSRTVDRITTIPTVSPSSGASSSGPADSSTGSAGQTSALSGHSSAGTSGSGSSPDSDSTPNSGESKLSTAASSTPGGSETSSDSPSASENAVVSGNQSGKSGSEQAQTGNGNVFSGYKKWICLVIVGIALLILAVLAIRKKCGMKNVLLVTGVAAVGILVLLLIQIQTVDEYYLVHIDDIKPDSKTVFISIRCDTAAQKSNQDYIPKNGVILEKTEYVLRDHDTVFDLLIRATKHNRIQLDYTGTDTGKIRTSYVKGIHYLYEYEFGDLSGWMYKVNGQFPNEDCASYVLSDKDVIEWVYSCDLGKDVGN